MGTRIVARCPMCRGRFPWDSKLGFPTKCPLPGCDYVAKERDETVISMPALRSAATKNNDKVYRDIEKGSEVRAQMAAEAAGVPVSEMSGLKITNLRDNVHEGESYAMPVNNAVSQQMAMIKARGGQVGFGADRTAAMEYARTAQSQAPRAGIRALETVNQALLRR